MFIETGKSWEECTLTGFSLSWLVYVTISKGKYSVKMEDDSNQILIF